EDRNEQDPAPEKYRVEEAVRTLPDVTACDRDEPEERYPGERRQVEADQVDVAPIALLVVALELRCARARRRMIVEQQQRRDEERAEEQTGDTRGARSAQPAGERLEEFGGGRCRHGSPEVSIIGRSELRGLVRGDLHARPGRRRADEAHGP